MGRLRRQVRQRIPCGPNNACRSFEYSQDPSHNQQEPGICIIGCGCGGFAGRTLRQAAQKWPAAQDAAERIARLELELVAIREDVTHELSAVSDTQWRLQEVQGEISGLKSKASKLSERAATLSRKTRVLNTYLPTATHMEGMPRRRLEELPRQSVK